MVGLSDMTKIPYLNIAHFIARYDIHHKIKHYCQQMTSSSNLHLDLDLQLDAVREEKS